MKKSNEEKRNELLDLITQQSLYISQLENENKNEKDNLQSFTKRLAEVIDENQFLHDQLRSQAVNQTINIATDVIDDSATKLLNESQTSPLLQRSHLDRSTKKHDNFETWKKELENAREMYKAQLEGLETENKVTQRNLEQALRENELFKETINRQDNLLRMPATLDNKTHRSIDEINTNIPIIERLTKERDELTKSIASLRNNVMTSQAEEARLRRELQKSLAAVEDIQLEKSKANIEKDRIAKILDETQIRLDQAISDTHRRSSEAAANERKLCREEIHSLNKQVTELQGVNAIFENKLESAGRTNTELMGQLDESRRQLLQANQDLGRMRSEVEHEVKSALKGYKSAEEELRETRSKLEQELLKNKQERTRLDQEATDLQHRLEAAQEDALKSRQLNLRLTEETNQLKQKLQKIILERDAISKKSEEELSKLTTSAAANEKTLQKQLKELQFKYESRLTELENIGVKQANLNQRLREEGNQLQDALNKLSKKYRKKVGTLAQENEYHKARVERLSAANQDMEEQIVGHGITHRQMRERLLLLEERAHCTTGHAASAMEERDRIAQDRDLLDREVKFLQSQILPEVGS